MALTPQEQAELDQLELAQLEAEYAKVKGVQTEQRAPDSAPARPVPRNPRTGLRTDNTLAPEAYAAVPRYGLPMLASEGGPRGIAASGLGEKVAQMIEGRDAPGEVTAAMVSGAIPFKGARGAMNAVRNIAKAGAGAYAAEQARSLIDEGKSSDRAGTSAGLASAISSVAPVLGAVAGKVLNRVDPADAARMADLESRNATRDASLAAGRDIGMVYPPTAVNDTWLNRRLEGWAGSPRVARQANVINNEAGGVALRKDIGLSGDAALSNKVLDGLEDTNYVPYREVAGLSDNGGQTLYYSGSGTGGPRFLTSDANAVKAGPNQTAQFNPKNPLVVTESPAKADIEAAFAKGHDAVVVDSGGGRIDAFVPEGTGRTAIYKGSPIETASDDFTKLKQARADEIGYLNNNKVTYDPSNAIKAKEARELGNSLDDRIREAALLAERADLPPAVDAARIKGAKIADIRRALNPDNGSIDLNSLGRISDKSEKLTGNTKAVADFANATEGKFTRPEGSFANPGASALEGGSVMGAGAVGGPKAFAIALASMLTRDPVRYALLSKQGQRLLATPNYTPRTSNDPLSEAMLNRIAVLAAMQREKEGR